MKKQPKIMGCFMSVRRDRNQNNIQLNLKYIVFNNTWNTPKYTPVLHKSKFSPASCAWGYSNSNRGNSASLRTAWDWCFKRGSHGVVLQTCFLAGVGGWVYWLRGAVYCFRKFLEVSENKLSALPPENFHLSFLMNLSESFLCLFHNTSEPPCYPY